jgi:HlyD family secretion protein
MRSSGEFRPAFVLVAALCILAACGRAAPGRMQGYVEAEFVYVSSPLAGTLEKVSVQKGAQVKTGDLLFALESIPERAARDEAQRRLAQATATLEDARKGKRPTEIQSVEAQLRQAQAAAVLSRKELDRQERLFLSDATSAQNVDRARAAFDQDRQRVAQGEAELKTAQLGLRADQIAAAEANMRALEAALSGAEWELSQKRQAAPQEGQVFDTLYREGEWVAAGRPVVALLPPQNIKVRAFVPERLISAVHRGERVQVFVDGLRAPLIGAVSFVSPRAEYTPPVIYSRESRGKLVFMIEVVFDPGTAAKLNPGQPVDVQFGL